ncbi:MAG: cupin domain-containing protein [bacterium]|nr:cupin domain-containing protein [bacterium]
MGVVSPAVRVVPLQQVEPILLPRQSWSRMLVTRGTVGDNQASLGYSVFTPGTVLTMVSHEVEEVAFVVAGRGELRLEDGVVAFGPGDALFIPPRVWHAVANTGDEDLVMVFGFPHPEYPPTQRRSEAPV